MQKCIIIGLCLLCLACGSKPDDREGAVARVGDEYLYQADMADIVPDGTSKEDSALIVKSYIDRWATHKLLINAAEVNISDKRREALDQLVDAYRADLYTKAYIDELVKRSVDTVVAESELSDFYEKNKDNFKANGSLVRLRYLHLQKDNPKFATIRSKFFDYRKSDAKFWETHSMQMKSFALNDSVWVDMAQVYHKLPFITPENRDKMIVPGKAIEQPVGDDVYLVKIVNVIGPNQQAPYQYLKPTLRDIIINSRKLDMIKKIEKEITDDAIKDRNYEVYK